MAKKKKIAKTKMIKPKTKKSARAKIVRLHAKKVVKRKKDSLPKRKKSALTARKSKKVSITTDIEKNQQLAIQFTQFQNQKELDKLRALLSPHFLSYVSDIPHPLNRDQFIEALEKAHQAFSNLIITIEDVICHEDKVILRLTIRGKHTGTYQGIAPTYKEIKFVGMSIRRIKDGKIFEEWQINDQLSLVKQLGFII